MIKKKIKNRKMFIVTEYAALSGRGHRFSEFACLVLLLADIICKYMAAYIIYLHLTYILIYNNKKI